MVVRSKQRIKKNIVDKSELPTFHCRRCKKDFAQKTSFYTATNIKLDANGLMSICKDCCREIYEDNFSVYKEASRAMYETCYELDVCFNYDAFSMAYKQYITFQKMGKAEDADLFGYYKSKLSSLSTRNAGTIGLRFKDSDSFVFDSDQVEDVKPKREVTEEEMSVLKLKWGEKKDKWEYEFLENELHQIQSSFECSDYSMEMLQKDIAYLNLAIEKERRTGGDAQKLIESRQKLMADGKMKPVQASGIDENDAVTFGTLIKKWENDKPIPTHIDDEMKKYIDTFMVGHLAKMEGLKNEVTEKLDKELDPYSIDFDSISGVEQEDVEGEE